MNRSRAVVEASSPSRWALRTRVLALALGGAAIATYLTLYQWHITHAVWDPVFGSGSSEAVLTSSFSRMLPLPDATLGAFGYLLEAALTAAGGSERWRTARYLVLVFGAVLLALAVTAVVLLFVQALLVRAFCMLCLISAAISLLNLALGSDEVAQTLRLMARGHGEVDD